jgi:hypothetical protein
MDEFHGTSLSREQYEELWKATLGFTHGADHVRANIMDFPLLAGIYHDVIKFCI